MNEKRVRIADIAEELGLSTATVSNVIHGKTKKISDETVKRVQQLLEERQYIPSMAGLLLAQNDSRIIGVVVNNHEKYEGHVLEDGFIASSLNYLSEEIEKAGYFMMVKTTQDCREIIRFASMWNMEGLVVIGFCGQDYQKLREAMHIPFVVYEGYFTEQGRFADITIDNYGGGFQVGSYLKAMGHQRILYIADNCICMDQERYEGLRAALEGETAEQMVVPMEEKKRRLFYKDHLEKIRSFTAVFAASDYYALDFVHFLRGQGVAVPEEISVVGFDDNPMSRQVCPALTTVRQDGKKRAEEAIRILRELKEGSCQGKRVILPVELVVRESVRRRNTVCHRSSLRPVRTE